MQSAEDKLARLEMSWTSIDAITFEVLHNALVGIVDEMGELVTNVAFSLVVSEGRDYSASICNAEGDLVTTGQFDQPAHIGTVPFAIKGMWDWIGKSPHEFCRDGDIIIMNDAYVGNTHNNDVRLVMPVHVDDEIVAFVQGTAHWTDIGGHVPGTFDPNARSSHGEGLMIPPMKLVEAGVLREDVVKLVLRNIRWPEIAYGDLLAQIGACRLGCERIQQLMAAHGKDLILREMRDLITYSETLLRQHFAAVPDGKYEWTAWLDQDPGSEEKEPVPVRLAVTIEGDRATYDFSATAPTGKGAINGTRAAGIAAAWGATKLIFPDVPLNQGILHAIDIVLPPGTVMSAIYPAPVSGMAATVYPAVTDCVQGCFIQMIPERCSVGMTGLTNVVIGGFDPRRGYERDYVSYLWQEGGWGARVSKKDNHTAMPAYAAAAKNQPVELYERIFPIMFHSYTYETDSGGAGYHRGGMGVSKSWLLTDAEGILSTLGDGEKFGPWGWAGGHDAPPDRFILRSVDGQETNIGLFRTGMRIERGELLTMYRAGGGGYGNALERPVDWVLADVLEGLVSVEAARELYGVIVSYVDWQLLEVSCDLDGTAALRQQVADAAGSSDGRG